MGPLVIEERLRSHIEDTTLHMHCRYISSTLHIDNGQMLPNEFQAENRTLCYLKKI